MLNFLDDVVIELQLHKLIKPHKIVYLQDILVRKKQALDLTERDRILFRLDTDSCLRRPQGTDAAPARGRRFCCQDREARVAP